MKITIEEQDSGKRRLLKIRPGDVTIQALIGDGTEYEVASKKISRCHICGGKVLFSCAGEMLSPNKLLADEDGAYGSPHRHSNSKKKAGGK